MTKFVITILLSCVSFPLIGEDSNPQRRGELLILQGSAGTEEYGALFSTWAKRWQEAAAQGDVKVLHSTPLESETDQKTTLIEMLSGVEKNSVLPLWIVMIGHGTFDGRTAKFNLAGPDLSAKELDKILAPIQRTTIIINCASSSAPFLRELSQRNRIVITSTRSGEQINFSRFGEYLSAAIAAPSADLDKDRQTSLLEAFLMASRKTLEYYAADGRIPTEDALIDDNADAKGTRASAFQGVRVVAQPEEQGVLLDGFRAHQFHLVEGDADKHLPPEIIAHRNGLEQKIELLRLRKCDLEKDDYYEQLEVLFLELGKLILEQTDSTSDSRNEERSQ